MVDTTALGAVAARRGGSSPLTRTITKVLYGVGVQVPPGAPNV